MAAKRSANMEISKYSFFNYYPGILTKLYVFLRSCIIPVEEVEKCLPEKGLVYDLGCGYGVSSLYFALKGRGREVVGVDIDKKRINVAKKAFEQICNLSFSVKDITKDRGFRKCDCIVACDLLHHLPYRFQKSLLGACRDNLKKGGLLVIKEIDGQRRIRLFYTYVWDKVMTLNEPLYYTKRQTLIRFLEEDGFRVKYARIRSIFPYPHYILACKRC